MKPEEKKRRNKQENNEVNIFLCYEGIREK
jgi:hypothetical protein